MITSSQVKLIAREVDRDYKVRLFVIVITIASAKKPNIQATDSLIQ
jgi:hypothetical protein